MSGYTKQDPQTIQTMFNSIAQHYDLANSVLSFRLHKRWNHYLVRQVMIPNYSHAFLDLCCGTGDIAFDYLQTISTPCQAYLIDFCTNMLTCAKEKSSHLSLTKHQLHYIEADAQSIPLLNETIDCTTIAYGIRNIKDPTKCIQEVYRVLKPGGRFGILELTRPKNPLLRLGHHFYLKTFLPFFGKWLTFNQEAYHYLRNSIDTFIPPQDLETILNSSGFTQINRIPLLGGIATIFVGHKPG
jgi:demethylmenaquinone methyltransferase/2-methoxy-6-polyprenyl-1,4-benzoquinol methylase